MDKGILGLVAFGAAVGGLLYYGSKKVQADQAAEIVPTYDMAFDPSYMMWDAGIPTENVSTDDSGGTVRIIEHNIGAGPPHHVPRNARESRERVEADYPTFTGGTFLNPGVLPPIRYARLQSKITGGKFVRPDLLPPEREVFIQKGSIGPSRRREDE